MFLTMIGIAEGDPENHVEEQSCAHEFIGIFLRFREAKRDSWKFLENALSYFPILWCCLDNFELRFTSKALS